MSLQAMLLAKQARRVGLLATIDPAALPPLTVDGQALTPNEVYGVLSALKTGDQALISLLRSHIPEAERDTFTQTLFEAWRADGARASQVWALNSLTSLGGEGSSLFLAAFVNLCLRPPKPTSRRTRKKAKRETPKPPVSLTKEDYARWPLYRRAGIAALTQTESKSALLQLYLMWLEPSTNQVMRTAHKHLSACAHRLGLTVEELGDRIVPDVDLTGREFDYGSRRFTFALDREMTPLVRDSRGKLHRSLPRRKEQQGMEPAGREWHTCKTLVEDVRRAQTIQLERAMVDERRWSVEVFDRYFRCHPLMRHFAPMLLWGVYRDGSLVEAFCIDRDLSLLDSAHRHFTLDWDALIGVVHPLHLDEARRAQWGEVLHDHEIIPPFAQLNRPIFTLTDEERRENRINRFDGRYVGTYRFNRMQRKLGWRWQNNDSEYVRHFPIDHLYAAQPSSFNSPRLGNVVFKRSDTVLPIETVSPRIISEIIYDLTRMLKR